MNALGIDIGGTSVKIARLEGPRTFAERISATYERPTPSQLAEVVRSALASASAGRIGVCLPGVFDPAGRRLTASVNHPNLIGLELEPWLASINPAFPRAVVIPDTYAAAYDAHVMLGLRRRTLAVSLGTGVGACVLDDGVPLKVSPPDAGLSSGHLGQIDISMIDDADPPIGRDGGRGSVEAYLGAPALEARFGPDLRAALPSLSSNDVALRALVRLLRIAHAIYRPDTIVLLGGIGMGLRPHARAIRDQVADRLTALARPGWTLRFGEDEFHAARGAARLAIAAP